MPSLVSAVRAVSSKLRSDRNGLRVTEQIKIEAPPNLHNESYLRAKRDRMGHILHHQGLALDEEMIHGEKLGDRSRREQSGS